MKNTTANTTIKKVQKRASVLPKDSKAKGNFDYLMEYVKNKFQIKFPSKDFHEAWAAYNQLQNFKISENVETVGGITEEAHYIMRTITEYHFNQAFKAMKIDMNDPNVGGEKGTPYRMAKMYCGSDLNDASELLSGRWSHRPEMASFPNENDQKYPITKRVDIVSVCSHHTAPFSTLFRDGSYALISYIPDKKVLGISKLQRIVDWVARRGHLQENLTKMIYDEVCQAAESESVYIKLSGLVHTCESLRGTQSNEGAFSSEYYGGAFKNFEIRREVSHQ
ncbi:GTP cyclohydrolase I [Saccharicrinis fermentans]|uniref:GTP cyclohydrolase I n=1 Tax=Saccharicrinis fermentans DSM 9555 = JCM 21142 TaxID=869213 RepID=W7XWU3_9BACT|nr:GTP cyclohydrolase I [Saccharicrinis fermentans]GAF02845.1 GTP cyclohydrolase 1 [Saccharicrinis fermentans DSM 9555 = JCM 21142]